MGREALKRMQQGVREREIRQVGTLRAEVKCQRESWKKIFELKTIVKFLKTPRTYRILSWYCIVQSPDEMCILFRKTH